MVTGHLEQRRGYWHAVLNLRGEDGKTKRKSITTHLTVKGNKRRAEEVLTDLRKKYTTLSDIRRNSRGIFFDEYMVGWINSMNGKVAPSTYNSYNKVVKNSICPYFKEQGILLNELKPIHIEEYYEYLHERGISNSTIIKHHNNMRKALQDAYQKEMIAFNPADRVNRPKVDDFISHPYSPDEANRLLEAARDHRLGLLIMITLVYGLRRSEVLGLRWGAIDFERETIIINHSVTQVTVDGKCSIVARDKVKRTSSFRTMPLIPMIKESLLKEKEKQNPEDSDYVFADANGKVVKLDYISHCFGQFLKKNGLRPIRFHDLRHSCANLLIGQRVPLIEVQQWLGHSSISTTADLYTHLDFSTKQNSAETLKKI